MEELTMREIQQGALCVLKQISQLCQDRGWRFFVTYGSMIGAVRHKGIIPWDDDIDIMMPRPDYEQLKLYFREHSQELLPLKLFDTTMVQGYPHMISRVSDQRYHLVFDNEKDYDIGLFVDIYPLDGVGNDYSEAISLIRKTKKLASLCFLTGRKSYATDNTDSKMKMLLKFPAYIWAKCMGNKHYIRRITDLVEQHDYENSKYVACAAWPAGKKYGRERDVFEKDLFERLIWVDFEDTQMPIIQDYDKFLSVTYGDYMTPPSEEGKKVHHSYHAYVR